MQSSKQFDSSDILSFLYSQRKLIGKITLLAVVVSVVASLLLTPKYKSTAIIFPTMTNTVSRNLLEQYNGGQRDHLAFGEEEHVEQTLQVLNSNEIRDKIAQKYNLLSHYGISANDSKANDKVKNEFEGAVKCKATEYMSIKIEVIDKSADTAALIANDILAFLDSIKYRMTKERAVEAYQIVTKEYLAIKKEVNMMEDSMETFRNMGIYDHELQVQEYTRGYAKAIAAGNANAAKQIEEKLNVFKVYGGRFLSLKENLWAARGRMTVLKVKMDQTQADVENTLPYKFVVNKADVPQKKHSPIRSLIVLVTAFSAFAFTCIVLLFKERFGQLSKSN
ncbi:MAG: hypothetical protein J0M08_09580 [Bacteroidetes bacterium]|nr:hypothetical protein [Bacteroidota bacterium]